MSLPPPPRGGGGGGAFGVNPDDDTLNESAIFILLNPTSRDQIDMILSTKWFTKSI